MVQMGEYCCVSVHVIGDCNAHVVLCITWCEGVGPCVCVALVCLSCQAVLVGGTAAGFSVGRAVAEIFFEPWSELLILLVGESLNRAPLCLSLFACKLRAGQPYKAGVKKNRPL